MLKAERHKYIMTKLSEEQEVVMTDLAFVVLVVFENILTC